MQKLYIMLAILLGLLLLGCVQPAAPETKYVCQDGKTTVTDITQCPAAATSPFASELAVCSGMPLYQGASLEDLCIIGIAGKHKETALCTETSRDQRLTCYAIVAELKADPDTCLEAGSEADKCFEKYAQGKKDGSICNKISDVSYKDSCYSSLASQLADPELCDKIRNISQKDSCYFGIAMRLSDSSYCNKIANEQQKQNCLQNLSQNTPK